jgi:hypothetical protein
VLISNAEMYVASQALFGLKKTRRLSQAGEIHLNLDPSTTFTDRPILLAECDTGSALQRRVDTKSDRCHETTSIVLPRLPAGERTADDVYPSLLFPFADLFCFFANDLGGLRQTAQRLALWLEKDHSSTLPESALPSVVIVTSNVPPKSQAEEEARKAFLCMLGEETARDPYQQVSAINVVALFPNSGLSADARYRHVKERFMRQSDQVRKNKEESRVLFSGAHLAAFLKGASAHFAGTLSTPFDLIGASRVDNPVAPDLTEHFSNFLKHVNSSNQLKEFAVPMLASSLLLDSYPPDSHGTQHNS